MSPLDNTRLPKKVVLTGSDCFHLVLDRHARNNRAGSNVMRIVFYFNSQLSLDKIKDSLGNSPLIHWLCNIRLRQGSLFGTAFWEYQDKGNGIILIEHQHPVSGEIPKSILERDIPLDEERFVNGDIIHYPFNKTVFVLSWNHILMDGRGIAMLIQHLSGMDKAKNRQEVNSFFPTQEKSTGLFAHIRNMYRVKKFIETSSKNPIASVAGQGQKEGKRDRSFHNRIIRFTPEETGRINRLAIRKGAKFGANLYYLSCCIHAVNRLYQQKAKNGAQWIPVPYDGRLRGSKGPIITNTVAFLFYRVQGAEMGSIEQTIAALSSQMTSQIDSGMPQQYGLLLNMMRHIPIWLYYFLITKGRGGSVASFLYSSTGEGFNHIETFFGEPVVGLTIYPSPTFPPGLTFSFLKHQEALNINIAYATGIIDTFEISDLELGIKELLLDSNE